MGTTRYSYTAFGALESEDGPWANDTVTYAYNSSRVRSSLSLLQPNASDWTNGYSYDASGRLKTLTSQAGSFTYDYKVGQASSLPLRLSLPGGSYITNAYDADMRLTNTWLKTSAGTILNSHAYVVNNANQRTKQTFKDGNYVDYTYDNMGQLMSAKGKESGGSTSRLQEQLSYVYDQGGNLNYRTNNALVHTFNVNSSNQLTTITRSGTLTVAGTTSADATNVTVNTQTATRYADNTFVKDSFSLTNGDNTFTAVAQDNLGRADTNAITVYLPDTASFTYDSNGNLTSDGKRGLEYDDENQLIRVTVTNVWKSEFTYDGKMRRRIRKEYAWQSSAWVLTNEVRYVYDGMLAIQERDANNVPTVTYTRGNDLSGTLEGAGGIGGLFARTVNSQLLSPNAHAFYQADGNGNITALVNDKQAIVARYQYDPFGNILSSSGPLAEANAYRFSSKDYHHNSGFIYYGYRFYEANLQRWVSSDPIEEEGGVNLYAFVAGDPIGHFDQLGLVAAFQIPGIPSGPTGLPTWGVLGIAYSAAETKPKKRTCDEICKDAQNVIDPTRNLGGIVACENGLKCACPVPWPGVGYTPGGCPDLDNVIKSHEKNHFGDVDCPKNADLKVALWKDTLSQLDQEKSECARAKDDIPKLTKLSNKLKGHCQDVASKMLAFKVQYMKDHNCATILKKK